MHQYTEQDLNYLIEKHLTEDCSSYAMVCRLKETPVGKERIITRIKEIIFSGGVKNIQGSAIDAAIATIESELMEVTSSEEE